MVADGRQSRQFESLHWLSHLFDVELYMRKEVAHVRQEPLLAHNVQFVILQELGVQ